MDMEKVSREIVSEKIVSKEKVWSYAKRRREMCAAIKRMIVEQLCLDLDPEFITDDQPLFGRGLELDSIDALELAVGIYSEFSVTISDGDSSVFSSVNQLADYIMEKQEEGEKDDGD